MKERPPTSTPPISSRRTSPEPYPTASPASEPFAQAALPSLEASLEASLAPSLAPSLEPSLASEPFAPTATPSLEAPPAPKASAQAAIQTRVVAEVRMLDGSMVTRLHEDAQDSIGPPMALKTPESGRPGALQAAILINHHCNAQIWQAEELARCRTLPAPDIVRHKRTIDRFNLLRNEAIERINSTFLGAMQNIEPAADAWCNSETVGSIIDRLSILFLKEVHVKQALAPGAGACAETTLQRRLKQVIHQHRQLAGCLDQLLEACWSGRAFFEVQPPLKMYDDPQINRFLE